MVGYASHQYVLALGSNVRHQADGSPRQVLRAAVEVLEDLGILFHRLSPVVDTAPIGPSLRRYANACALVESRRSPPEMLGVALATEQAFGRNRVGERWSARVLDIDLVLWDGGIWDEPGLVIPHPEFRKRDFVLGPARRIVGDWRDPVTGLSVAQLHARLTKPRAMPR